MSYATLLFAMPSFMDGLGRTLDAGGVAVEFNQSLTGAQADRNALRSDWSAVGADLWTALQEAKKQLPVPARGSKQEAEA